MLGWLTTKQFHKGCCCGGPYCCCLLFGELCETDNVKVVNNGIKQQSHASQVCEYHAVGWS